MYTSFLDGVAHPVNGVDHILAMAAVGLWAVLAGGRALWAWPAAFVAMVLLGFVTAITGFQVPVVQPAISSSIVVVGLLIAFAVRAPVRLGVFIAGLFAFFHGHAHGTEAAGAGLQLIAYASGFSFSTAALHCVGLGAGLILTRRPRQTLLRTTGAVVAISGLALSLGTGFK